MAIPTSRTSENAEIRIDQEKCNGCGICVNVCKDFSLEMIRGKVTVSKNPKFGCIGCGHCMAVCPSEAIAIYGRALSPDDLFDLPLKEHVASYDQLLNLQKTRRSNREFKKQAIDKELTDKIVAAARTAPMGIPPSDVNLLILDSPAKVRNFSIDFCAYLESIQWFVSKWFLALMRPFWSKSTNELFSRFIRPLFDVYISSMKKGVDVVTYDAPLAIYFYGSPYADPADPLIAATYAMLAGESLGLGTCMLGAIHPMIQNGQKAKAFREKHGIRYASPEGIFVIFGYPKYKFRKGINRTFASVYTPN